MHYADVRCDRANATDSMPRLDRRRRTGHIRTPPALPLKCKHSCNGSITF